MLKVYGLFLVSGLAVGSLYALGGIGLVVLRRSTGVLNFAYGAIAAVSAMLCWQIGEWGMPGPVAWGMAIVAGVLLSVFYGRAIAPSLSWREPAVKAVATLGYTLILLGMVGLLWDDAPRKLVLPTDKQAIMILGVRVTVTRLIVLLSSVVIVICVAQYLERTRMGLHMRALADNRSHASLLGIPVLRVETLAWAMSGALAGYMGVMFGDLVRLEPTLITFMVVPAIAAAICGGLTSLPLTLAGGLTIGVIEALLTMYKPLAPLRTMTPFIVAGVVIMIMQGRQQLTFASDD